MKFAVLHGLVVLAAFWLVTDAYLHFQKQIPNGDYIPHPCKPNFVWKGVGHINQAGGGARNQFGKDFNSAGKKWTTSLCNMDSDGDGKSNGQELGDPNCTWKPGTVPDEVTGITHPGVCEPWGSTQCQNKNDWVSCESDEFKCPAIEEEDVFTKELRFPWTNVPAKATSYMCMGFDLPSDGDYHMIATKPIINETRVMHHIALIACTSEAAEITEPTECLMGLTGCSTTIGLWTLGLPGECLYRESGIRIGTKGMKRGVLQFHWTNPEERSDLWDASGMTLYFTKKLRKYDSGTWSTGQLYLEIPPLSPRVVQQSTCSGYCTRKQMNQSIFLTSGLNHMHYLGVAEYVKLKRQDGSELMLTDEKHYSYDTPILNTYDPPIEVKPGDEIETVCTYQSLSRKVTARYGEGTFDEMCFGIFNFFPTYAMAQAYPTCTTNKNFNYCDIDDWTCNYGTLWNFTHPETKTTIDKVMKHCTYQGDCLHGCRAVVNDLKENHSCFMNGLAEHTLRFLTMKNDNDTVAALRFVAAMQSCDCRKENPIVYIEEEVQNLRHMRLSM
ncbi:hypothetical protein LOTGIDRAFT_234237 [Lottia gigantea]|uniref:DOMON domain-containing protein n=1 Tax=Lottia gigantea TaxID=225164 RepID=V3ZZ01_LOTGI|nr:hypothetical protein LOTGIDRAFT_234237 [Lottia gigantea]ESO89632.1 hypothetical protein LOTGIDRAFT_234237 [Lottia gigantea]